jgi:hypothetical protein
MLKGIQEKNSVALIFDWLIFDSFLQLMSVELAWKSAAKNNEKLVIQKYATLFLSWMPFNITHIFIPKYLHLWTERIVMIF